MKLIEAHNPIIRQNLEAFDFDNPVVPPLELVEEMQKVRLEGRGVGLAANQVGVDTRVIVIGTIGEDFEACFFNPVITMHSKETDYFMEGCLTFPGLWLKIKRPTGITLMYQDVNGEGHHMEYNKMVARILQHEIDHLYGITFKDRANKYHLQKALKDMKKTARIKKKVDKQVN